MIVWEALLMVYRCLDVRLPDGVGRHARLAHALSDGNLEEALSSFGCLPALVTRLSEGEAGMRQRSMTVERCLDSLSTMGEGLYWPSPSDTRAELDLLVPPGSYDSVFVLWPQTEPSTGAQVPSGGWGLAIGATDWSNGATYATVANASRAAWSEPVSGEVWLHEWLHGACDHFRRRGVPMPEDD